MKMTDIHSNSDKLPVRSVFFSTNSYCIATLEATLVALYILWVDDAEEKQTRQYNFIRFDLSPAFIYHQVFTCISTSIAANHHQSPPYSDETQVRDLTTSQPEYE